MSPATLSRRTITFVNIAHALEHFVLLVYPTAEIAMAPQLGQPYASLIGLSEQATFTRCCRRWLGTTPTAVRRDHSVVRA